MSRVELSRAARGRRNEIPCLRVCAWHFHFHFLSRFRFHSCSWSWGDERPPPAAHWIREARVRARRAGTRRDEITRDEIALHNKSRGRGERVRASEIGCRPTAARSRRLNRVAPAQLFGRRYQTTMPNLVFKFVSRPARTERELRAGSVPLS